MRNKHEGGGRDNTVLISLHEIDMPERTVDRLMRRDYAQIDRLRVDFESGRNMLRVIVRPRCGGGYDIEEGRHRVIAAKLAGLGCIEALLVSK